MWQQRKHRVAARKDEERGFGQILQKDSTKRPLGGYLAHELKEDGR